MTQGYTTFIPGYVFNIFEPLYTRVGVGVGTHPYTFYTIVAYRPVNLFCAKIFLNKVRNIELSLRALLVGIL